MAEDEIRKHAKLAVSALTERGKSWKQKSAEVMMEILIIIFAVSISIWFHSWAESWKDREDEKTFFSGLKDDLQADLEEMKSDRAGYERRLQGAQYFEKVGSGMPLNNDSLNSYVGVFFGYTQISPRISRFEALKGSGRLNIIRNKKLLIEITDLYTKDFPTITMTNNWLNTLRQNSFFPFVAGHLELDPKGKGANWQDLLRTSQMRLLVYMSEGAGSGIGYYSAGIEKSERIIRDIDKELHEK